jgi:hypothetical protein
MHETAIQWAVLHHARFFLSDYLSCCLVTHSDANLSDNTIFPLAIASAVNKDDTFHLAGIRSLQVASLLLLVVFDEVEDVLYWHLSVTNDKLFLVLEHHQAYVEEASLC